MRSEYQVGPVYRAGLIVSGSMCAGLGIAVLAALALHRPIYAQGLPASISTPPASAIVFVACGLALVGVAYWFPRLTAMLAMVVLSMAVTLAAEWVFGAGPRVETMIAANLGEAGRQGVAPNTLIVLSLGAAALLLRHNHRWFETRLCVIAILGSIDFAIGAVASVGYMTGIPVYAWQSRAPMSFLSAICSCALGLGIVMSAWRYSELDESGTPRWFGRVVCIGALAVNVTTVVAFFCKEGKWRLADVVELMPMMLVSGTLAVVAGRQARQSSSSPLQEAISQQLDGRR
jgi:hypothetical protein